MRSGNGFGRSCLGKRNRQARWPAIRTCSSMPCSGGPGAACRGATYPLVVWSLAHSVCPVSALVPSWRAAAGADLVSKRHEICALVLTGCQAGDCPQAPGLLGSHLRAGQGGLADRAYDADDVRVQIGQARAGAVIPGKRNRTISIEHDTEI
jgi:hypothetical protein